MKILFPPFRDHVETNRLIEPNDTIILGFSGGKDSVTLLCLLQELGKHLDFRLVAAYFNHKLRSDAQSEQQWVEGFCRSRGIELVTGGKDVIRFKDKHKLNLEHAASLSRYTFFRQVSARFPNAKTATAHTKSDLTETFLIKLFRGSGLQGLTTIYSKKENTIIRPLLLFSQEEIFAFLERGKIDHYRDSTNDGDQFLRNQIRHHVVPEIQKIEPAIHGHVFRTVSIIQEEYDYFSRLAGKILAEHLILGKILPVRILGEHHVAVQRHIIREYIRLLKGNLLNIDFAHIEAVRTCESSSGGLAVPGVELAFQKGYIFPNRLSVPGYRCPISGPGSVAIDELQQTVTVEKVTVYTKPADNGQLILPYSLVKFPMHIRSVEPGDRYVKLNTRVNQKVIEMIRAAGYPSPLRNLCPVVENGDGEIIWVLGSPLADRFKVTDKNAGEFLLIRFFPVFAA